MQRKFVTEYSISYLNSLTLMLTAHQLMSDDEVTPEQADVLSKCNIYIIAARPSARFKDGSIKHENNKLSACLLYKINGVEHEMEFSDYTWILSNDVVSIKCEYPHKEIISYDADGNEHDYIPAYYLAMRYSHHDKIQSDLNTYEVLYVGQAIGNTGNRSAIDRLRSHATLQKILARTNYEHPDKEIMIFMYSFDHEQMISCTDGRAPDADNTDKNEERLFTAIENPPNKKQKIGLIEAGLIRYFQPDYNKDYKIKYPSSKHKVLRSCYDLDISGYIVELNLENLGYYLYSNRVEPKCHHIAKIDLFHSIDRSSFFSPTEFKVSPDVIG